jgi:hypothetical protein
VPPAVDHALPPWWERVPDAAVSWFVGAIAWWTVVFHVGVPAGLHRDVAGAIWLGGLAVAAAVLLVRRPSDAPERFDDVRLPSTRLVAVLVAAAVGAAALSATRWPDQRPAWWVFWATVVACSAAAVWLVAARARRLPAPDRSSRTAQRSPAGALLVLGLAALAAIGSMVTMRPDADDVFLVNRSSYVAEHSGALPARDTLFSDEVFAATRPDAVPTSIEALVGVVAAWTPFSAPTVTYLAFGPLAAGLALPALWRMLRTLGAHAPALATAAASLFLLLDGGIHYTYGNFHFARAWQGKVVFLIVVVPAMWHHGLRWARDGSRRDLWLLVAAAIAGVGLTTTAALVGPVVTVAAVGGGALAAKHLQRFVLGLLGALPALLAVLVFAVAPAQDVRPALPAYGWIPPWFTLSGGIEPGVQWHWILDRGVALLIPAASAFVAWAVVRDRAARLALALAPLVLFGIFYGPGTFDAIAELTGVRVILWRTLWVLPIPAAIGLVVTAPLLLPRSTVRTALAVAAPVAMVVAMVLGSTWVLDPSNRDLRIGRPAWDVDAADRAIAQRLVDLSEPGDTVLAPEPVSGVIAIQTSRVKTVNPRGQYMFGRHTVPAFRARDRRLASFATSFGVGPAERDRLARALQRLDVSTACVVPDLPDPTVAEVLHGSGFEPVGSDEACDYWRRTEPASPAVP